MLALALMDHISNKILKMKYETYLLQKELSLDGLPRLL